MQGKSKRDIEGDAGVVCERVRAREVERGEERERERGGGRFEIFHLEYEKREVIPNEAGPSTARCREGEEEEEEERNVLLYREQFHQSRASSHTETHNYSPSTEQEGHTTLGRLTVRREIDKRGGLTWQVTMVVDATEPKKRGEGEAEALDLLPQNSNGSISRRKIRPNPSDQGSRHVRAWPLILGREGA